MKNPGKWFKIIDGAYKGKYCIAYDKEQIEYYLKQKRLFVHYFETEDSNNPVLLNEKRMAGIEKVSNLLSIDWTD